MALQLIPNNDLVFKGPFNAVSITTLKLFNAGNERLAYKIKTTAPKRYCVKPNSGFLEADNTANIQVMLQPHTGGQDDDRSKHKFMVQWAAVPSTYTEDVEAFWKQDMSKFGVNDSKLKCVFVDEQPLGNSANNDASGAKDNDTTSTRATQPTNPVEPRQQQPKQQQQQQQQTNKVESANSTALSQKPATTNNIRDAIPSQSQVQDRPQASVSTDGTDESSKSRLKQELDRLKTENENLKEQLKQQELRKRTTAGSERVDNPVIDRMQSNQRQQEQAVVLFGVAFSEQLALVAFVIALLFGFSLGYFLFSCGN